MVYEIKDYSFKQAKKLGVEIKPSSKKNKKIDVIKDNKIIASVGDNRFKDYPTHLAESGERFANERRRLYKIRHADDLNSKAGGYWSNKILW
jgi:hypothetical protein